MDRLARFVRSHVHGSSPVAAANASRPHATRAFDCVYILGPGHDQAMAGELRRRASHEGLTATVIGDGKSGVTREMIRDARTRGLIGPRTEVIALLHGGTRRVEGRDGKSHVVHTGFETSGIEHGKKLQKICTPTVEFLHWLRDALDGDPSAVVRPTAWGGTVHLVSCHVRQFAREFSPKVTDPKSGQEIDNPLWAQGSVLAYGSSKPILNTVGLQNFDALLRHLGDCKRRGLGPADVSETFRSVMVDSPDTVSLLGGLLDEPMVSHAPKTLLEATPGFLQARWQQLMAYEKLKEAVTSGSEVQVDRPEQKRGAAPANALPAMTRQKISQFFFTRIGHLRKDNKFDLLKTDLQRYPWLANTKDEQNFTPLMLIALSSNKYKGTEVNAKSISEALLNAGAEVDAQSATGKAALHYAAAEGNASLTEFLLKRGARISVADYDKRSALHWACLGKNDRLPVVKVILSVCDKSIIDKRDRLGKTALHIAITNGDVKLVEALLAAGADPENAPEAGKAQRALRGVRESVMRRQIR